MMTKEDIKKAFDICFAAQKSCNGCPLLGLEKQNGRGCKYNLFTSVFDLITEQEKEIERLKAENEEYAELFKMKDKDFFTITVEEWKKFKSGVLAQIKQAKIDVLNELREKYSTSGNVNNDWATYVYVDDIDEVIKEIEK